MNHKELRLILDALKSALKASAGHPKIEKELQRSFIRVVRLGYGHAIGRLG